MRYLLYGHGGSGNHGCEAIIRTTLAMIGEGQDVDVYTIDLRRDQKFGLTDLCSFHENKGKSDDRLAYMAAKAAQKITGSYDMFNRYTLGEALKIKDAVCLSVGGDNYCNAEPMRHVSRNKLFSRNNKTVLWGCSVTPALMQQKVYIDDMKRYALITARESLTYQALVDAGVQTAKLIPDPAFTLPVQPTELPDIFSKGDVVGVNISPTVTKYEKREGVLAQAADELIRHILSETEYGVALIPHVIRGANSDLKAMKALYEKYRDTGRIALADADDSLNCCQLKYIISKCRFMVVSRTHASIAAYSTSVPTLVIGYSVKSKGIATDLFGTDRDYVLPIDGIEDQRDLYRAFEFLVSNEESIRDRYARTMPGYIERAYEAGRYLREL